MITINKAIQQIAPEFNASLIENFYRGQFSEKELNDLLERGKKISTKIIGNQKKIFILIGQVQAGKTSTYASIIAHLFDKGSNFIVLTPSVDNVLLDQTFRRLAEIFSSSKCSVIRSQSNSNFKELNDALESNKNVIYVMLKNKDHLGLFPSFLTNLSKRGRVKKPLFIDDEGDQASFSDVNKDFDTTIHKNVLDIFDAMPDGNMLIVTATPFAHILVNENYPLKPDFCFYFKPGENYKGLDYFFASEFDSKNLVRIPSEEEDIFEDDKTVLPEFFVYDAVLSFFITSSLFHLYKGKISVCSMLLHVTKLTKIHREISKIMRSWIGMLSRDLDSKEKIIIGKIKKFLDNELAINQDASYRGILVHAKQNIDDFGILVYHHLQKCEITVVNSEEDVQMLNKLHDPKPGNYIYIGSTMLQRGVTITNLLYTYFTYRSRSVTNADTILQRARWFGYYENVNFVKVFLTKELILDFFYLNEGYQKLIPVLQKMESQVLDFKKISRIFYVGEANLRATRQSVVKNEKNQMGNKIFNQNAEAPCEIQKHLYHKLGDLPLKKLFVNQEFVAHEFADYKIFKTWFSGANTKELFSELNLSNEQIDILEEEIFNKKVLIVKMLSQKTYRERNFSLGSFMIAQGRNASYVGDDNWVQNDSTHQFDETVIFRCYEFYNRHNKNETIYKTVISLDAIRDKQLNNYIIPIDV